MLQGFIDQVRVTWDLMRDPRVPVWTKAIPVMAFLYVISPFDFVPDLVPGLGQLDDLGIILAGMKLFESMAPNPIVRQYRRNGK